jgi:hypothetical protein
MKAWGRMVVGLKA